MQTGLFKSDINTGQIIDVNDTVAKFFGYENRQEFFKQDFNLASMYNNPDDREKVISLLKKDGQFSNIDICFNINDNKTWLRVSARLIGNAGITEGIAENITDLKKAEENLKHIQTMMQYVIEHTRSAVAVYDNELRYIYVSKAYLEQYKLKDKNILGKRLYEVFPNLSDKIKEVRQLALEGIITSAENDSFEWDDGTIEWGNWECRPWYKSDGTIGGIIVYTEFITEKFLAEQEKEKIQKQLAQSQKMESIGRLASGVAHDFNNMLSVINGYCELVLFDLNNDHEHFQYFSEIKKAVDKSSGIAKQLLIFAKKQIINPKIINLNQEISKTTSMLGRLIGENIKLRWNHSPETLNINIDPAQLDQILANLCVNSRDAIKDTGEIIIETSEINLDESFCEAHIGAVPGLYVCLSVTDNGCGMDKDTLSKIFEPFFTTKAEDKGTGLGLATVYGIVSQNSGYISVSSAVGVGSCFKIYFPIRETSIKTTKKVEEFAVTRGFETILLVEDDEILLEMLREMLEIHGYKVFYTKSPLDALALIEDNKNEVDLLLSDLVMPEMNGKTLMNKIKELSPKTKTILTSGYTDDILDTYELEKDNVYLIKKTFDIHDITKKIREVLK